MHRAPRVLWTSAWTVLPSLFCAATAWAQQGAAAEQALASTGPWDAVKMLVPYAAMVPVVWFLLIRPGNNQRRAQQDMLAALKRDDEVLTQSGFVGRIVSLEETLVVLELADKVKVRMLRDRIVGPFERPKPAVKGA